MKFKLILITLFISLISGCVGFGYNSYSDVEHKIQTHPPVPTGDEKHDNWKQKYFIERFKYTDKLMEQEPLRVYEKDGGLVYVFPARKKTRGAFLGVLLLIPIPMPEVVAEIHVYIINNKAYKYIYTNFKKEKKGVGFICSPPIISGDWCEWI